MKELIGLLKDKIDGHGELMLDRYQTTLLLSLLANHAKAYEQALRLIVNIEKEISIESKEAKEVLEEFEKLPVWAKKGT
jgi:hypothetical protein